MNEPGSGSQMQGLSVPLDVVDPYLREQHLRYSQQLTELNNSSSNPNNNNPSNNNSNNSGSGSSNQSGARTTTNYNEMSSTNRNSSNNSGSSNNNNNPPNHDGKPGKVLFGLLINQIPICCCWQAGIWRIPHPPPVQRSTDTIPVSISSDPIHQTCIRQPT